MVNTNHRTGRPVCSLLVVLATVLLADSAQGHFVYVKSVQSGNHREAVVYFSEAAHVDGERLPQKVAKTQLWVRHLDDRKRSTVNAKEGDRDGWVAMFKKLEKDGAFCLEAHCDYGVHHGSMLRYRAKHLHVGNAKELAQFGHSKDFELDVQPMLDGNMLSFEVTWKGKPAKNVDVPVEDFEGQEAELTTDADGVAQIEVTEPGLYAARVHYGVADAKGQFSKDDYEGANFYTTVTLDLPAASLPKVKPLPEAVSSFGGVVCDRALYVYSGHIGKAHDHSKHNLSQHFRRLPLTGVADWEELPLESPLQGLALVTYGGHVYRIGGLSALNDDVDTPDLHSTKVFARFDPDTKQWQKLTPLPEPRSSHDAVVVDSKLYVLGGWSLDGDEDGEWHEHAVCCNLAESPVAWERVPTPFAKRALAAGSADGKVFAIGGMNSDHDAGHCKPFCV